MKPVFIEATTLSDAWHQCIYKLLELGDEFKVDRGSYAGSNRLEFDHITVQIKTPWVEPLLPKISERYGIPDPTTDGYLYGEYKEDGEFVRGYVEYLMSGDLLPGESYTYGQRINAAEMFGFRSLYEKTQLHIDEKEIWQQIADNFALSQVETIIWIYKNKKHRNNQMVLQVAQPTDLLLKDPPCLRHIDTRIQNNTLHFFPYFRSWDLWGGFPANLAAIELLKQYMAAEIGVKNGQIIAASKGLHIYGYAIELAEKLRNATREELKNETA